MRYNNPMNHYHLTGIGGVGMRALAQALLDRGYRVSGSDRQLDSGDSAETFAILRGQGVMLTPQDGSGVSAGQSGLIVSTAIEPNNPEFIRAKELGVPVVHRAQALADLAAGYELIAVAGTCGKSSVTAILGWILEGAGFNPAVVNGAGIIGWEANGTRISSVRKGERYLVAEVDESDKSLTVFSPAHAIITNASADHFGLAETQTLFDAFKAKVSGHLIDARSGTLCETIPGGFRYEGIEYVVPLPGLHNIHNAFNAVRMACALGADPTKIRTALAAFRGIERRLQKTGTCSGADVYDDYAHNPEKLAAAWRTLQEAYPRGVCGLWRPHGFGPLRKMMDDLTAMFRAVLRPCDRLILVPVYDAGGTADRSVNTDVLLKRLDLPNVFYFETPAEAEIHMKTHAAEFGALALFGARDPDLPRFARRLAR